MRCWIISQASLSGPVLLSLLMNLGGCKALQVPRTEQAATETRAPAAETAPANGPEERWLEVADFDCSPLAEWEGAPSGGDEAPTFAPMRSWASGGPAGATWNAETLTCRGRVWTACTQGSVRVELLVGSRRAGIRTFPAAELPPRLEFTVPSDTWLPALDDSFEQDLYQTALLRLRASLFCEEPFLAGPGLARHEDVVAEDRFVAGFAFGE
jgi:hypothetical protein